MADALLPPHAGQPVLTAGVPLDQCRALMIAVHGRGAGPEDILGLAAALDRPGFAYLAPAAAGHTWYPYSFMAEIGRNEPGLTSALGVLDHLVNDAVARGITSERIVLLGFSQGACLSAEYAVRHGRRYGGVIILAGGLIGPPGTVWNNEGSFVGTPVFLGCSDVDPHVPKARVDESAEVFRRMEADVTERLYPGMGHVVNADEIAFARTVMDRVLV